MKLYTKISKLPNAILFDLDNTIYNYKPCHKFALKNVENFISSKFNIEKKEFNKLYEDSKKIVKKQLGNSASSHNRLIYFQYLLEMIGLNTQVKLSLDLDQIYWMNFFKKMKINDYVLELLDEIRLLNIKSAMVTDLTTQIQFRKLLYLNIEEKFDYIITSEEVSEDKPNCFIFNKAIEKLNVKENIWMIGDDYNKDILGSKSCVNAIAFYKSPNIDDNLNIKPDVIFDDFKSIISILKSVKK